MSDKDDQLYHVTFRDTAELWRWIRGNDDDESEDEDE